MTAYDGALGHRARNGSFHFGGPGATGRHDGVWLPAGLRAVVFVDAWVAGSISILRIPSFDTISLTLILFAITMRPGQTTVTICPPT